MKTTFLCFSLITVLVGSSSQSHAQGLFQKLKKQPNRVLSEQEVADREGVGSTAFRKAEGLEQSGKVSKAIDTYKSIAKSYPNTTVGAESQYRVAMLYDKQGNGKRAYDEYKTLINKYRSTSHFQQAIERQFAIAESLKTSDKKGIFGIGAAVQPSDLKAMYEQIAESAPYSIYAPKSLMAIGDLDAKDGMTASAVRKYQAVVDNYRNTTFAKDAQYAIYKLRGESAENSNSPSDDRAQVDAGLDFVSQNPNDARANEVKAGLERIEERSLDKMYKTGQFYEKSGNHKSAIVYYREIAKKPNSPHYNDAIARINNLERILAGEAVEEKASKFGTLPTLPKIEAPKLRFGKKEEVVPLPAEDATAAATEAATEVVDSL